MDNKEEIIDSQICNSVHEADLQQCNNETRENNDNKEENVNDQISETEDIPLDQKQTDKLILRDENIVLLQSGSSVLLPLCKSRRFAPMLCGQQ